MSEAIECEGVLDYRIMGQVQPPQAACHRRALVGTKPPELPNGATIGESNLPEICGLDDTDARRMHTASCPLSARPLRRSSGRSGTDEVK